jgi:hypothetical protein
MSLTEMRKRAKGHLGRVVGIDVTRAEHRLWHDVTLITRDGRVPDVGQVQRMRSNAALGSRGATFDVSRWRSAHETVTETPFIAVACRALAVLVLRRRLQLEAAWNACKAKQHAEALEQRDRRHRPAASPAFARRNSATTSVNNHARRPS